jgi:hypothetical protein
MTAPFVMAIACRGHPGGEVSRLIAGIVAGPDGPRRTTPEGASSGHKFIAACPMASCGGDAAAACATSIAMIGPT